MKVVRWVLILLLGVTGTASGAPATTFVFDVTPSTATVKVNANGKVPADSVAPGQPYVRDAQRLDVHARADGYEPLDETIKSIPPPADDGRVHIPLVLHASSAEVATTSFVARHPWAVTAAIAGGVVACTVLMAAGARRRRALAHGAYVERLQLDSDADAFGGRRIGHWRIIKKLGQGGMASVYLAYPDETLDANEAVAIKLIHQDVSDDPAYQKRFEHEIRACMRLSHPNVMRLIDWGNEEGRLLYLVAEYLDGESLRYKMRPGGVRPDLAMDYLRPMMAGLIHAHERGLVHRDLKPENVMVTEDGQVKIMDLGLARVVEHDVSTTGEIMGTPGYMAPEQIRGKRVDARADQYAAGLIAFELLAGAYPLEAADTVKLLYKHVAPQPLPSVRDFKPTLGHEVERVISRMVEKMPEKRFPTMREALEALERACARR